MKLRKRINYLYVMGILLSCLNAEGFEWFTDFKQARSLAKSENKFMLLNFSGSDWCGWCMKLDQEVFKTDEFKRYADKRLVCVLLDFPQNINQSESLKRQNKELAEKYDIEGYPTLIILNPEGEWIGTTGYKEGGPAPYIQELSSIIDAYSFKNKS